MFDQYFTGSAISEVFIVASCFYTRKGGFGVETQCPFEPQVEHTGKLSPAKESIIQNQTSYTHRTKLISNWSGNSFSLKAEQKKSEYRCCFFLLIMHIQGISI